jgi:hypothetical protein
MAAKTRVGFGPLLSTIRPITGAVHTYRPLSMEMGSRGALSANRLTSPLIASASTYRRGKRPSCLLRLRC